VAHVIEPASSARAKCRGCGARIDKGELRLGERLPNPFAEGEMTHWFHIVCGAFKRPEPFLEALGTTEESIDDRERLIAEAKGSIARRRLPRIDGGQRAPTGRARCRSCRETIDKGAWRIPLVYYEEGRFQPSGFIHLRCARSYFDTVDVTGRMKHFSPGLTEDDLAEIRAELDRAGADES
jgi:hypothetical protein